MWVDSHCHLQLAGGAEHVARAEAAGVEWMVCVGTDLETSEAAVTLASQHDDVFAAVGLHPHDASKLSAEWEMLEPLAVSDECTAVGEAGFDLYYEHSPRDEQETAFRWQIRLAQRIDKPLVIHSRDAWDDTFRVLDDEGVPERTIFHCFTGGPSEARLALDRGCYLSFSGIVSFKNAEELRDAARLAPADRLLVETDSPFLAPEPYRGRENEPAYVVAVGEALARARSESPDDIAAVTRENAARVFPRDAVTLTSSQIRDLLDEHGVRPSKALGQNFLTDPNTARRIVRLAAIEPGARVIEVGPGIGSLTIALADAGAHVLAVELDEHLLPILREVVGERDVEIVCADAIRVDWQTVLEGRWTMVANLPYNVAASVVVRALETAPMIERFLVMVQREVGERLAAGVDDDAYGAVSVKVAWYAEARVEGVVPPTVFFPKPNVDSALVSMTRHTSPPVEVRDPDRMLGLVKAGFATRRKMLRRTLAGLVTPEAFERAGVDSARRAETLDLADWARLSDA